MKGGWYQRAKGGWYVDPLSSSACSFAHPHPTLPVPHGPSPPPADPRTLSPSDPHSPPPTTPRSTVLSPPPLRPPLTSLLRPTPHAPPDPQLPLPVLPPSEPHSPPSCPPQTLYSLFQCCVLLLLIVRLVGLISFQPRLAIIPRTLQQAAGPLAHLLIALLAPLLMLSMLVMLVLGPLYEDVSTMAGACELIMGSIISPGSISDLISRLQLVGGL